MTDFSASFLPIVVPSLPANGDADDIARFNATFVSSIVNSANSVMLSATALKNTDFYSVGDIPVLGPQLLLTDPDNLLALKTRPASTQPAVDWTRLEASLDQLAALAQPAAPSLAAVDTSVPTFDAIAPTIAIPNAPDPDVGAGPGAGPSILDAPLPDSPSVVIPAVPTFDEFQLPASPAFDLPSFTAIAPQNLIAPPTDRFSYVDPGYVSDLHDPLVQKLLSDLQNGSYGIDAGDEAALWFRARDRAAGQARSEVEEAQRRMAQSSFPMPQGAMIEAIDQAQQKAQSVLSEANREIGLRRSELYVEGRKFTIQQVQGYEKIRIDLYGAQQERALNAAKAVVELGVAVFDASVKNFQVQLDSYKTEASVFESRVRGELAKAEVFRAQIEAEKTRVEFNRAKLDLYNAQLAAINSTVELYKARLQAANIYTQIQGQRLEVFRSQVMAYAERVRAKEAEYGIYQAQIKGQLANLDVYKAQIDAYNGRISGLETRAKVQLQSNEALLQNFRAAVEVYKARLDAANKDVQARLEESRAKGIFYGLDVEAYRAYTSAADASLKVQNEQTRFNLDWNRASLAARVAQVEFRLKQLGLSVDLQKDVNGHGVDFMRAALGGAVSGLNSLGVSSLSG